jgi:hypothetical protein
MRKLKLLLLPVWLIFAMVESVTIGAVGYTLARRVRKDEFDDSDKFLKWIVD